MHRSVASHTTQIGTWPATQAHGSPDEESNWQPFGSKAGAQSTEPHQPGQPTLSHTASCVIVTALQWALPHDPSALLTSFAHKPCFCMFCPGPYFRTAAHHVPEASANPGTLLTAPGLANPLQPHSYTSPPLATILPAAVHHSSPHYTSPRLFGVAP